MPCQYQDHPKLRSAARVKDEVSTRRHVIRNLVLVRKVPSNTYMGWSECEKILELQFRHTQLWLSRVKGFEGADACLCVCCGPNFLVQLDIIHQLLGPVSCSTLALITILTPPLFFFCFPASYLSSVDPNFWAHTRSRS
jgi:hypothetical protein